MNPAISAGYLERIGPEPDSRSAVELIQATVSHIRIACEKMTPSALGMLRASVAGAASLPTRPGWERKAAAHAEVFRLLAQIAGDRVGGNPGGGAGIVGELMRAVGPAANGMITSSRQRLLEHLLTGDAAAAAREMETHLRALHYMWRLT
jgi:DNA-binding FadR family transcriptional regulator